MGVSRHASGIRNVYVAMTSSEPDPVVRSYDLMVSHALNDQLFVLQYPNRPAYLPFDSKHLQAASVKPKQTRVRLEYKVPAAGNAARFCPVRSRQQTDSEISDGEATPSFKLASEPSHVSGDHYAIAVLKDRTLHLNPLHSVVQMRPEVSHGVDRAPKRPVDTPEVEGDIVPLQMRMARSSFNQERTNQRRRERDNQEEAWVSLGYNELESGRAGYLRGLLFGEEGDTSAIKHVSNDQYMDQLAQVYRDLDKTQTPEPSKSTSLDRQVRNKPIREQLLFILRDTAGHGVKFSYTQALLGSQFSSENLLKSLEQVSMLVQGWFLLMSGELYADREDSLEMCRSRDFVLCHYALYKPLDKQETLRLLGISVEDFNSMFGPISSSHLRGRHSFKYAEDRNFIREHPALCERHSAEWREVYKTIQRHFKLDAPPVPIKRSPPPEATAPSKRAKLVPKEDPGSCLDSNSVRQLLGSCPLSLLELKQKVFSLYKKVKQENSAVPKLFRDSEMLDQVLRTVLLEINAATIQVSKNSTIVVARETGSPSDVYRVGLISCLEDRPSQKRQELLAQLKRSLGTAPSPAEFEEILGSICDVKGSVCTLKGLHS